MSAYVILTNRKRAGIALVHSAGFLFIALRGATSPSKIPGLIAEFQGGGPAPGTLGMAGIYLLVTIALVLLFAYSGCVREKLYFGLCATSAGTGLLRIMAGDASIHASQYIRVVMLLCAVAVGTLIWRGFSEVELSSE